MVIATRLRLTLRTIMWAVLLALPVAVNAQDVSITGLTEPPKQLLALWYSQPAGQWLEALPVGNGRLGAMVYGGVLAERIGLNEDTLWSGGPKDCDNPDALKTLPEIRALILKGEFAQAQKLGKKMLGPYTQSYLPMGDLRLAFDAGALA